MQTSAQARPRDEVMSHAFQCAVIGDSRLWLDCYYGSAQPVRAALGLQPAPPGQVKLATQPPVASPTNPEIAIRDQVMSYGFRCNMLTNERQWLECYYASAQPMRAHLGLPPAPQLTASLLQHSTVPDNFGIEERSGSPIDHIDSRMANYSFGRGGIFAVTLANGEVWQQMSGDTNNAHWAKSPGSYIVRISRGFFGSYNLSVNNGPISYKVHRIA
jgi:hypothetical protein